MNSLDKLIEIVIAIDEQEIAGFLNQLASENIHYTQISIDKPTLEDYFLQMSLAGKKTAKTTQKIDTAK